MLRNGSRGVVGWLGKALRHQQVLQFGNLAGHHPLFSFVPGQPSQFTATKAASSYFPW